MKVQVVLFCLAIIPTSLAEKRGFAGVYTYPTSADEIKMNSLLNWSVDNFNAQARLKEIKYHIINGNLDLAKLMLSETTLSVNFTKQIQHRYMAMVHFIEGHYELALQVLAKPEMQDLSVQVKTCLIKALSLIILERTNQAKNHWTECKRLIYPYSKNNLTWIQTIVDLKTTQDSNYLTDFFKNIKVDNLDANSLRIYLKWPST